MSEEYVYQPSRERLRQTLISEEQMTSIEEFRRRQQEISQLATRLIKEDATDDLQEALAEIERLKSQLKEVHGIFLALRKEGAALHEQDWRNTADELPDTYALVEIGYWFSPKDYEYAHAYLRMGHWITQMNGATRPLPEDKTVTKWRKL